MDKEREIEEMANIMYNADIGGRLLEFTKTALDNLLKGSGDINTEYYKYKLFAEELIDAGYRKADEVEKKTARKILGELWNFWYKTRCQLHYKKSDGRIVTAEKTGASNVCDKLIEEIERQSKKFGVEE